MSSLNPLISVAEPLMLRASTQASAAASHRLAMGNTASSPPAGADGVPLPTRDPVDTETSTSPSNHAVARSVISDRGPCSTIGTSPMKPATNELEIIDLCSDSDDSFPPAPKKKTKLDDVARDSSSVMEMENRVAAAKSEAEAWAGKVAVSGILNDVTGRLANEDAERKRKQQEEDVKDKGSVELKPGAGVSEQHVLQMASADFPAGSATVTKDVPVPTADAHHITNNNGRHSTDTFAAEDILLVEIRDPGTFTTPRVVKSSEDVKPVLRIETIQTQSGVKKRKLVGPFVVDDDDPADEGYGSFSSCTAKENQMGFHGHAGNSNSNSNSNNSEPISSELCPMTSAPTKLHDMEVVQRRRRSEDKCAEMSRQMRKEALAKRKADMQKDGSQTNGLSKDFLEDVSHPTIDAASLTFGSQPLKRTTNAPSMIGALTMCASKEANRNDKDGDNDDDDPFGESDEPTENVEAQLDLVQAFAHSKDNTLQSAGDLSRSRQPCTSASSGLEKKQKADDFSDLDSQSKGDRALRLHGSIPPREKQLLGGKQKGIATSGIEHYDSEQVEKYWTRMVRDESSRKEDEDAKAELELAQDTKLPARNLSFAHCSVIGGAMGKDEARLLTVKEPLRAAPNMSGGLARLVQMAEEKNGITGPCRGSNDHRSASTQSRGGSPPLDHRGPGKNTLDEASWTRDVTIQKRKRDIDNLMNTWTETAKCWWIASDAISPRYQKCMRMELQQLRRISDMILCGFSSHDKAERRIGNIKANMIRRARRHQMDNPSDYGPSTQEIDRQMFHLMGEEQCKKARMMLGRVHEEYESFQQSQKQKSHLKRAYPDPESSCSQKLQPRTQPNIACEAVQEISSEFGKLDQYEELKLTHQKRTAWQKEDAKIEQIKERLARFEKVAEPAQRNGPTKKVHFADQALWENEFDDAQISETEESDEDEDETAPSFGRGDDRSADTALRSEPGPRQVARKNVGGKGLLSQLRKDDDPREPSCAPIHTSAKKRLSAQKGPVQYTQDVQNPTPDGWSHVGGESVSLPNQLNCQGQVSISHETSEIEDSQSDTADLMSEAEAFAGEDDKDDTYAGTHVLQYDIVADYESFDDYQDANLVPLGRHIDIKTALRQMKRVATDVAASASRKHRQLRIIWDTDDFELAAHTVILPTGGECRIRMVKSWGLVADWPGKQRPKAVVAPKVFYIVHETKTTSLRPSADDRGDGGDDDLFGPEDFEDLNTVMEKERDMCFSSRRCANEIAKNRLMAFNRRHEAAADYDGMESNPDLTAYMEQIEHDKVCFEQEKRFWIENKDGRKGKEEVKIWVEEMIADMPHI
jgi:hypothetical protein